MAKSKHNKEDILDVGIRLFWQHGYNATGVNEITKAANIPKGTFYNFFENKIDFAKQAIDRYGTLAVETHMKPYLTDSKTKSYKKRLLDFYNHLIKTYGHKGCLWLQMSNELGGISSELDEMLIKKKNEVIDLISTTIKAGVETGEITKTKLSPAKRANLIVAQFDGILCQSKVKKSNILMTDFLTNLKYELG